MSRKDIHALRYDRMYNRRPTSPFTQADRIQGVIAYLDDAEPAHIDSLCETLYQEDWSEGVDRYEDLLDDVLEVEDDDRETYYDADPPNMYSPDDHWLPWAKSIGEVRDIFGGGDFIIIHSFRA